MQNMQTSAELFQARKVDDKTTSTCETVTDLDEQPPSPVFLASKFFTGSYHANPEPLPATCKAPSVPPVSKSAKGIAPSAVYKLPDAHAVVSPRQPLFALEALAFKHESGERAAPSAQQFQHAATSNAEPPATVNPTYTKRQVIQQSAHAQIRNMLGQNHQGGLLFANQLEHGGNPDSAAPSLLSAGHQTSLLDFQKPPVPQCDNLLSAEERDMCTPRSQPFSHYGDDDTCFQETRLPQSAAVGTSSTETTATFCSPLQSPNHHANTEYMHDRQLPNRQAALDGQSVAAPKGTSSGSSLQHRLHEYYHNLPSSTHTCSSQPSPEPPPRKSATVSRCSPSVTPVQHSARLHAGPDWRIDHGQHVYSEEAFATSDRSTSTVSWSSADVASVAHQMLSSPGMRASSDDPPTSQIVRTFEACLPTGNLSPRTPSCTSELPGAAWAHPRGTVAIHQNAAEPMARSKAIHSEYSSELLQISADPHRSMLAQSTLGCDVRIAAAGQHSSASNSVRGDVNNVAGPLFKHDAVTSQNGNYQPRVRQPTGVIGSALDITRAAAPRKGAQYHGSTAGSSVASSPRVQPSVSCPPQHEPMVIFDDHDLHASAGFYHPAGDVVPGHDISDDWHNDDLVSPFQPQMQFVEPRFHAAHVSRLSMDYDDLHVTRLPTEQPASTCIGPNQPDHGARIVNPAAMPRQHVQPVCQQPVNAPQWRSRAVELANSDFDESAATSANSSMQSTPNDSLAPLVQLFPTGWSTCMESTTPASTADESSVAGPNDDGLYETLARAVGAMHSAQQHGRSAGYSMLEGDACVGTAQCYSSAASSNALGSSRFPPNRLQDHVEGFKDMSRTPQVSKFTAPGDLPNYSQDRSTTIPMRTGPRLPAANPISEAEGEHRTFREISNAASDHRKDAHLGGRPPMERFVAGLQGPRITNKGRNHGEASTHQETQHVSRSTHQETQHVSRSTPHTATPAGPQWLPHTQISPATHVVHLQQPYLESSTIATAAQAPLDQQRLEAGQRFENEDVLYQGSSEQYGSFSSSHNQNRSNQNWGTTGDAFVASAGDLRQPLPPHVHASALRQRPMPQTYPAPEPPPSMQQKPVAFALGQQSTHAVASWVESQNLPYRYEAHNPLDYKSNAGNTHSPAAVAAGTSPVQMHNGQMQSGQSGRSGQSGLQYSDTARATRLHRPAGGIPSQTAASSHNLVMSRTHEAEDLYKVAAPMNMFASANSSTCKRDFVGYPESHPGACAEVYSSNPATAFRDSCSGTNWQHSAGSQVPQCMPQEQVDAGFLFAQNAAVAAVQASGESLSQPQFTPHVQHHVFPYAPPPIPTPNPWPTAPHSNISNPPPQPPQPFTSSSLPPGSAHIPQLYPLQLQSASTMQPQPSTMRPQQNHLPNNPSNTITPLHTLQTSGQPIPSLYYMPTAHQAPPVQLQVPAVRPLVHADSYQPMPQQAHLSVGHQCMGRYGSSHPTGNAAAVGVSKLGHSSWPTPESFSPVMYQNAGLMQPVASTTTFPQQQGFGALQNEPQASGIFEFDPRYAGVDVTRREVPHMTPFPGDWQGGASLGREGVLTGMEDRVCTRTGVRSGTSDGAESNPEFLQSVSYHPYPRSAAASSPSPVSNYPAGIAISTARPSTQDPAAVGFPEVLSHHGLPGGHTFTTGGHTLPFQDTRAADYTSFEANDFKLVGASRDLPGHLNAPLGGAATYASENLQYEGAASSVAAHWVLPEGVSWMIPQHWRQQAELMMAQADDYLNLKLFNRWRQDLLNYQEDLYQEARPCFDAMVERVVQAQLRGLHLLMLSPFYMTRFTVAVPWHVAQLSARSAHFGCKLVFVALLSPWQVLSSVTTAVESSLDVGTRALVLGLTVPMLLGARLAHATYQTGTQLATVVIGGPSQLLQLVASSPTSLLQSVTNAAWAGVQLVVYGQVIIVVGSVRTVLRIQAALWHWSLHAAGRCWGLLLLWQLDVLKQVLQAVVDSGLGLTASQLPEQDAASASAALAPASSISAAMASPPFSRSWAIIPASHDALVQWVALAAEHLMCKVLGQLAAAVSCVHRLLKQNNADAVNAACGGWQQWCEYCTRYCLRAAGRDTHSVQHGGASHDPSLYRSRLELTALTGDGTSSEQDQAGQPRLRSADATNSTMLLTMSSQVRHQALTMALSLGDTCTQGIVDSGVYLLTGLLQVFLMLLVLSTVAFSSTIKFCMQKLGLLPDQLSPSLLPPPTISTAAVSTSVSTPSRHASLLVERLVALEGRQLQYDGTAAVGMLGRAVTRMVLGGTPQVPTASRLSQHLLSASLSNLAAWLEPADHSAL